MKSDHFLIRTIAVGFAMLLVFSPIAGLGIGGVQPASAAGTLVDDFEDGIGGWTLSNGGDAEQSSTSFMGDYGMAVWDDGDNGEISTNLPNSNPGEVSFWVKHTPETRFSDIIDLRDTAGGTPVAGLRVDHDYIETWAASDGGGTTVTSINSGEWYKISLDLDYTNNQYTVRVYNQSGSVLGSQTQSFENNVNANVIQMSAWTGSEDSRSFYVDEIGINGYTSGSDVSGTVLDEDRNGLEGSAVELRQSGSVVETVSTDASGDYTFSGVSDGTYTLRHTAPGYKNRSEQVTVSGSDIDTQLLELTPNFGGRVVDAETGAGVSNATVKIYGFNYSAINKADPDNDLSRTEIRARVENQYQEWTDPVPPQWNGDTNLLGSNGVLESEASENDLYAVAHSASDWGLEGQLNGNRLPGGASLSPNPRLSTPSLVHPSGEALVLHVRDGSGANGVCADSVDGDLPGGTTSGENIVVQRLGPAGGAVEGSEIVPTGALVEIVNGCGPKTHHAHVLPNPDPGYYRIYPEGNEAAAYTFAVAPNQNREQINAQLREEAEQFLDNEVDQRKAAAEATEEIDRWQNDQRLTVQTVQTNATGHWVLPLKNSSVEEVAVQAYRAPDAMDVDRSAPPTINDIRDFQNTTIANARDAVREAESTDWLGTACGTAEGASTDFLGSSYAATPQRVAVPNRVRIEAYETGVSDRVSLENQICKELGIAQALKQAGHDELISEFLDAGNLTREKLRENYERYLDAAEINGDVCRYAFQQLETDAPTGECIGGATDDNDDGWVGPPGEGLPVTEEAISDAANETLTNATDAANAGVEHATKGGSGDSVDVPDDADPTGGGGPVEGAGDAVDDFTDGVTGGGNGGTTGGDGPVPNEPTEDIGNETVTVTFPFKDAINETGQVIFIDATLSNGTRDRLRPSDERVTIEDCGFGSGCEERLIVQDYPLGDTDPAQARFSVRIVGKDGASAVSTSVTNPTFSGQIPRLESIRVSTLDPGPNEQIEVAIEPEQQSLYGEFTRLSVRHAGESVNTTNVTDGTASFVTQGQGRHQLTLTYTTSDGTPLQQVVTLGAYGQATSKPATIRIEESMTGDNHFGLVSGEIQSAAVSLDRGSAEVTARVTEEPNALHLHAEQLAATNRKVRLTVVQAADGSRIEATTPVVVHFAGLSDGAHVRVNGNPIPDNDEGSKWGVRETHNATTTVSTHLRDGQITVRANNSPGFFAQLGWWLSNIIPLLLLGAGGGTGSIRGVAGALAAPVALAAQRGWPL